MTPSVLRAFRSDPMPRRYRSGVCAGLFLVSLAACQKSPASNNTPAMATQEPEGPPAPPPPNTLTAEEQAEGFRLLFDGQTLDGWKGWKKSTADNWRVEDGTIAFAAKGGDLLTAEEFADFELRLDWKISPGGNSGIMFRVSEDMKFPWETGPEMQILDDDLHGDGKNPATAAGANYALHPAADKQLHPVGQWNEVRLIVKGDQVEQWLNGKQVVAYRLWDEAWTEKVAASKFSKMPRYGLNKTGHIVLQDHGDPVWFRNIRIKPL